MKVYCFTKKKVIFIFVFLVLFCLTYLIFNTITQHLAYKQKLEDVIAQKDRELVLEENNSFIVTKEMRENPKYQKADGSLNMEAITKDLGISLPKNYYDDFTGALETIKLSEKNKQIEPHVLGQAELAIYSKQESQPWVLEKGDQVTMHVYVDTEYYTGSGNLCFGLLKKGEDFSITRLDLNQVVESEAEFNFYAPDMGEYYFYLFRNSTEPIIIKKVKISIH